MFRRMLAVPAVLATLLATLLAPVLDTGLVSAPAAAAADRASQAAAADRRYQGVGDDVIRVRVTRKPGLIRFTHDGDSNFIVRTLDRRGKVSEYLVNEIGEYDGTVLYNGYGSREVAALSIRADGHWTATFMPVGKARCWCKGTIRGRGDQVLKLTPTRGLRTMRAVHTGGSNFIVHGHTRLGRFPELLVNEIGRYRGRVVLPTGTRLVTVKADGAWTLTRR